MMTSISRDRETFEAARCEFVVMFNEKIAFIIVGEPEVGIVAWREILLRINRRLLS